MKISGKAYGETMSQMANESRGERPGWFGSQRLHLCRLAGQCSQPSMSRVPKLTLFDVGKERVLIANL